MWSGFFKKFTGGFFLCMYFIQHCFICRPSDSTVSEDALIEPRTVATSALAIRRSSHTATSHPHSAKSHPHSATSHPLKPKFVKRSNEITTLFCRSLSKNVVLHKRKHRSFVCDLIFLPLYKDFFKTNTSGAAKLCSRAENPSSAP